MFSQGNGKKISSLQLHLKKYKKYDLKKYIPSIQPGSWISSSPLFFFRKNGGWGGGEILIKIDIHLLEV